MATTKSAVSARKLEANRRNAARSTGPTTDAGKARSCRNAVTHGIFTARLLLPGEDAQELADLNAELTRDLAPRNSVERLLVERIVSAAWRLRRLHEAEDRMFDGYAKHILEMHRKRDYPDGVVPAADTLASMIANQPQSTDRSSIYERRLEGTIHRCLRELRLLRKDEILQNEPTDDAGDAQRTACEEKNGTAASEISNLKFQIAEDEASSAPFSEENEETERASAPHPGVLPDAVT